LTPWKLTIAALVNCYNHVNRLIQYALRPHKPSFTRDDLTAVAQYGRIGDVQLSKHRENGTGAIESGELH
jgi:hypothetical protein